MNGNDNSSNGAVYDGVTKDNIGEAFVSVESKLAGKRIRLLPSQSAELYKMFQAAWELLDKRTASQRSVIFVRLRRTHDVWRRLANHMRWFGSNLSTMNFESDRLLNAMTKSVLVVVKPHAIDFCVQPALLDQRPERDLELIISDCASIVLDEPPSTVEQIPGAIEELRDIIKELYGTAEKVLEPIKKLREFAEFVSDPTKRLLNPVEKLIDPLKELRDTIDGVRDTIELLRNPVGHIRDNIDQVRKTIELLRNPDEYLRHTMEQLRNNVEQLSDPVKNLEDSVKQLLETIKQLFGGGSDVSSAMSGGGSDVSSALRMLLPKQLEQVRYSNSRLRRVIDQPLGSIVWLLEGNNMPALTPMNVDLALKETVIRASEAFTLKEAIPMLVVSFPKWHFLRQRPFIVAT
ncbi:hypothetical protein AAVH_25784 [Aphelenchoides avenae]|nr:hypothetical protein AAVH_25784 [Aphelenchus avenae]